MQDFGTLTADEQLADFIENRLLPGLNISQMQFWSGLEKIITTYAPQNRQLVAHRELLQKQIDDWHIANRDKPHDATAYKSFLQDIGYLQAEPGDFEISTSNVDAEIAHIAGAQLVVPVSNARFALNAANARWGSLYDALYGTDAISGDGGAERGGGFNPIRGEKVISWSRRFLDQAVPLSQGSHSNATAYRISDGKCLVTLEGDKQGSRQGELAAVVGYTGSAEKPASILCRHNGLHVELLFNENLPIAKTDKAGMSDIMLEAALSTIMDFEDSVAAVDAADKVAAYRNWLGLMKSDLSAEIVKGGKSSVRRLAADRQYTGLDGDTFKLPGRALMFARNVGLLMTTSMVRDGNGNNVPEFIIDTCINACAALHDLGDKRANSRTGSIYFVVPKMHGPDEVAYANDLFGAVEQAFGLDANTIKMGIMDEERRTSVNLKACIHAARNRVCFINTGFLDRTGDEIHTSMQAGAMVTRGDMKSAKWIIAYEDRNVDIGLACGFSGRAQIGKGMWAMPDLMADMLEQKQAHPLSGANTAWVPSPTAAVLHATHYHQVNVHERQKELAGREIASLDDLLTIPLAKGHNWSGDQIQREIENSCQSILGYMVRWIEQGIGCSKVPDINNVALMEDRATLRISSQHMANWLMHGVIDKQQALAAMEKMAAVVDRQNAGDPAYINMAPDVDDSIAFQAACDLVCRGMDQPSGYTEPVLHQRRLEFKAL
ncbi:Malate synthase G [hydrothermal vent metagenome]|uniref:Malate synthase G n=1 Tax=hydrothermal vent metagenome TaxID=652676 RepID=A0A3B0R1W9_9ZZZZ